MYIKRHIEKTLKSMTDAFPAVLLTGPRQVGKSTVIREGFPEIKYLTLDDMMVLSAMREDPSGFLEMQGEPLAIDEVQRSPKSFLSLKMAIDSDRKPGKYILTGSQKYELMENISESLAGRIGLVEMLGLSSREIDGDDFDGEFLPSEEYLKGRKPDRKNNQVDLWKRIHTGSMPELYANDKMTWEAYYASYVETYVERDVKQLTQVGDTLTFVQFMISLAARTGSILNMNDIAKDVGIDAKTVKRWIAILQASGIVYLLQPFYLNVSKRIVKKPKIYFTDTGIVSYLCRWLTPEALQNGAMSGGIFETFVVSEILKSYYNVGKKPSMYFFRNSDGQEVDLVFYQNGALYPIEIKKTASPNTGDIRNFATLHTFFPSLEIKDGGVICSYSDLMPLEKGRWVIPVGWL